MPKPIHRGEYETVRALLPELRTGARMKQAELSRALGKPQPYVSAIETEHRRVDLVEIRDICKVLGIGITLVEFVTALEKDLRSASRRSPAPRSQVD